MSETKDIRLIVVSGKKGSGKNTVPPLLMTKLGAPSPVECSFGAPLKDIIDKAIVEIRGAADRAHAVQLLSQLEGGIPTAVAQPLCEILYDAVKPNPHENAHSHSPRVVAALQFYGTEFRRAQDPDYWVKIAARRATELLQAGKSPYFTDARFPNEIEGMRHLGAVSVRLDVDPEEQRLRLLGRDGYVPSEGALTHTSETALDDYTGFDARVKSDGVEATVDAIIQQLA